MQDLNTLLQPLNGPAGCGEDLSFSSEFDRIREARRADDASLAQGEWIADVKQADWDSSASLCAQLLAERSKDLRVAGWYAEAQAKLDGFAGLAHGCALMSGLIERYWDHLYPEAEDGDQELRIGTLSWFVGSATELIRHTALTHSPKGHYSLADQEAARAFEAAMDKHPDLREQIPDGKPTLARIAEAQRGSSKDFYRQLQADLAAARSAWDALATAIDARLGVEGPSFREVVDAFEAVGNLVQRIAREQGALANGQPGAGEPIELAGGLAVALAAPQLHGTIQHRSQALQLLRQVADFFQQTEPHSPVTYLARKAADWGEMPLHEWLATVIKDGGALAQVNELLGVRSEQDAIG